MTPSTPNHYATLGLDRGCTAEQIRTAYRLLSKQHHPDLNSNSREAVAQTQALNAAYEMLGEPARREAYDRELNATARAVRSSAAKSIRNISEDVHLRLEDFLRGTAREVRVMDPGHTNGPELYELVVPPQTAPGTRFRIPRHGGGFVTIRVRPLPHFQFKVRGFDLRCDLKINSRRAAQGGEENVKGISGFFVRVRIKSGVARGEIIRIPGEGLPRSKGGRGDLLVRVLYQPEVRIYRRMR